MCIFHGWFTRDKARVNDSFSNGGKFYTVLFLLLTYVFLFFSIFSSQPLMCPALKNTVLVHLVGLVPKVLRKYGLISAECSRVKTLSFAFRSLVYCVQRVPTSHVEQQQRRRRDSDAVSVGPDGSLELLIGSIFVFISTFYE